MGFDISDVTPYLPVAGQALSTLISAIEAAIAAHGSGDPEAALAALNSAIDDVGKIIDGLPAGLVDVNAGIDAERDAAFPASPLAPAAAAVMARARSIAAALSGSPTP